MNKKLSEVIKMKKNFYLLFLVMFGAFFIPQKSTAMFRRCINTLTSKIPGTKRNQATRFLNNVNQRITNISDLDKKDKNFIASFATSVTEAHIRGSNHYSFDFLDGDKFNHEFKDGLNATNYLKDMCFYIKKNGLLKPMHQFFAHEKYKIEEAIIRPLYEKKFNECLEKKAEEKQSAAIKNLMNSVFDQKTGKRDPMSPNTKFYKSLDFSQAHKDFLKGSAATAYKKEYLERRLGIHKLERSLPKPKEL
jgi:hypothetical protein